MRVMITIPQGIYDKLEADRGSMPRSTYIQDLIRGGVSKEGVKLESKVPSAKIEKVKKKSDILDELLRSGKVRRGSDELPSQDIGGHKAFFK